MNKFFLKGAMLVALAISIISFPSCSDDKTDDVINTGTESGTKVSIEKTFLSSLLEDQDGGISDLTYDSQDRLVSLISKIDGVIQYSVDINYNADGQITKSKVVEISDDGDLELIKNFTYSKDTVFISYDSSVDTLIVVNDLLQTWRNDGDNVTTYKYDTDGDIIESVCYRKGTTETIVYKYSSTEKGLAYDGILPSWVSIYDDFGLIEFFNKKRVLEYTYTAKSNNSAAPTIFKAIYEYVDVDGKPSKITRTYHQNTPSPVDQDQEVLNLYLTYEVKK